MEWHINCRISILACDETLPRSTFKDLDQNNIKQNSKTVMYAELQMTRTNPNSLSELLSCATATVCEQILMETHCGQFKSQTYWPFPFDRTMWGVSLQYEVTARIRLSVPCASVIILLPCRSETALFQIPCKMTSGMVWIPFSSAVISRHFIERNVLGLLHSLLCASI